MTKSDDKLSHDLEVLEAMAAEMDEYLRSDVLFWPMGRANLPRLTLGGYLMRQHRLLALRDLLDADQRARLEAAVERFDQALSDKIVRSEARATQELAARVRQWGEFMKDLGWDSGGAHYPSAVETRAMIAALMDKLSSPPYRLEEEATRALGAHDRYLRNNWQPGAFIWPEGWQPAYPEAAYWWLYGLPRG
ncbi:MAG: hypothetical protein ACRDHL_12540 [Candidatus Promineifilaceae bacterium]